MSGLRVQCCGDAHLANFGGFAAPDRTIVFDINDFDETLPGPWEWDVKRLVASFEIAARSREFDDKVRATSRRGAPRGVPDGDARVRRRWATSTSGTRGSTSPTCSSGSASASRPSAVKRFEKNLAKARSKDSMRAFAKLTTEVDGAARAS